MKTIKRGTQFKKDFKRYRNYPEKVKALMEIVRMLENDIPIPAQYDPHVLLGEYKGHWECHIENDYLLIWIDLATNCIKLERLGTHSELFRK